ncbi:MAG: UDP-2,3-diacylglucosamine pyrophosphatase [Robiginitomaculum sp.]|nr:MAG: UDP-2,3-diacylglucosamine pyrophosphatase [Robiginitomaculum sp.]
MKKQTKPKHLGLIVGGGELPQQVAKLARQAGMMVYPVNLSGFAKTKSELSNGPWRSIGQIGGILEDLKDADVSQICFAGIVDRPNFSTLQLDEIGRQEMPRISTAAQQGDDALMRAVLSVFENAGFDIIGPDEIAASLLAPAGQLGTIEPNQQQIADMNKAAQIAKAVGQLDIGQGAIVCRGVVLAVEAQEGTDAMLRRCASLPKSMRGTRKEPAGVLVKTPKPGQEMRIDLPTIGVETVQRASEAGLAGIGFVTGQTFLLERKAMLAQADRLGLFLFGLNLQEIE